MRSELRRAIQLFAGSGAIGGRALLVAIIAHAADDAAGGDVGAAAYLLGDTYHWHLELIGLPADYLPAGLTRAGLAGLLEAAQAAASQKGRRSRRATSPAAAAM